MTEDRAQSLNGPDVDADVPLTRHGKLRFRQRAKLPLRALRRMVKEARANGLSPTTLPAHSQHRLASIQSRLDPEGNCRQVVYRGFVFVFNKADDALVTIYPADDGLKD